MAPDRDRSCDASGGDVDRDEAVVELIDDEEAHPVLAECEVPGEAVRVTAAVQVKRSRDPARRDVQLEDSSLVRAAVVETAAIRRESASHVRAGAKVRTLVGSRWRDSPDAEGRLELDDFDGIRMYQRRAAASRRHRQAPRARF